MAAIKKPSHQMQEWLQDLASKKPGAASADTFTFSETNIENNGFVMLDVMANDSGGRKTELFAVSTAPTPDESLLQRDVTYTSLAAVTAWEYSTNGARFAIVNGKVAYDGTFLAFTLGEGEQIVDHISYAIKLPNGHLSFTTVAITITGTNDGPTLHASFSSNTNLSEDADPWNAGAVSAYGAFNALDNDLSDTLTASVSGVHLAGTVGSLTVAQVMNLFTLQQTSLTADYYEYSNLGWNFNASDATFDFLNDGEQLTLTYDVHVKDNHGLTATDSVTININGVTDLPYNVAPVVTVKDFDSAGQSLSEGTGQNVPLYASGSLSVSDANRKDLLTATIKGVTVDDPTQSITADQVFSLLQLGTIYQPQADHNLQWTFSTTSGLFDHLQIGENVTLTYSVEVSDGNGGVTLTPITMVITGSGEAPTVSLAPGDVQETIMYEDGSPVAGAIATVTPTSVSAHGTLTVSDPHGSAGGGAMSARILYVNAHGFLGIDNGWTPPENWFSVSIDPNKTSNNLSWTFEVDRKFLEHIPDNGTMNLPCVIEIDDGSGNTTMTTIDVVVSGLNDAPVRFSAEGDSTTEIANSDTPTASGRFTIYDADEGDTAYLLPHLDGFSVSGNVGGHTVDELLNYANISIRGGDLAYTSVAEWTYDAPVGTFDYLAPGETVTMNYAFDVEDGAPGSFFTQSFSVTIVGAQDLPV